MSAASSWQFRVLLEGLERLEGLFQLLLRLILENDADISAKTTLDYVINALLS